MRLARDWQEQQVSDPFLMLGHEDKDFMKEESSDVHAFLFLTDISTTLRYNQQMVTVDFSIVIWYTKQSDMLVQEGTKLKDTCIIILENHDTCWIEKEVPALHFPQ